MVEGMILYLRDDNRHRVDKIQLDDGCFPTVALQSNTTNNLHYSTPPVARLEPALWSLILLVDKIFVDCKRRRFSWTTGSEEDATDPSQFVEDECYEYNDDVDQLFVLAEGLIESSWLRKNSRLNSDSVNTIKDEQYSLIRMLYCYILPKVELVNKDLSKVRQAISRQTASIQKIDVDIEEDSKKLRKLYQDLQNHQHKHLDEFTELFETKKCTKEFIKIFEKDLNKRINHLSEELDAKQTIVNSIKVVINKTGETTEISKQLTEARREVRSCHEMLQGLLMVSRDTIKTACSNGKDFLDHDTGEIILEYRKIVEKYKQQKIAANNQMDKKVHARSILENLKRIEQELMNGERASSTGISNSGKRETDVIDSEESPRPEYQTLGERVSGIVRNPDHPLGAEFQKFTTAIHEQCQEILDGTRRGAFQTSGGSKSDGSYLVVSYDGTIQKDYLWPLEELCRYIKEHFHVMSTNLREHFDSNSTMLKNKLQLHYEENFYNEVGEDIAEVYNMAHLQYIEKTTSDLKMLSMLPINCLKLGMKEEWWLELFEKRRRVIMNRSRHESERTSLSSLNGGSPPNGRTSSSSSSGSSSSSPVSVSDSTMRRKPETTKSSTRMRRSILSVIKRLSRNIASESSLGISNQVKNDDQNGYDTPEILQSGSPNEEEPYSPMTESPEDQAELSKFEEYFGPSLACLTDIFTVAPVFSKLQCLTQSLRKVTKSVEKLRYQVLKKSAKEDNDISLAITGDDILPLIVLMILQMDENVAAALQGQLKMMQDLIPTFLSAGCHGWAMMEFEMACQVLQSLCYEFEITDTH